MVIFRARIAAGYYADFPGTGHGYQIQSETSCTCRSLVLVQFSIILLLSTL